MGIWQKATRTGVRQQARRVQARKRRSRLTSQDRGSILTMLHRSIEGGVVVILLKVLMVFACVNVSYAQGTLGKVVTALLTETIAGKTVLSRVARIPMERLSEGMAEEALTLFQKRLGWAENAELATKLRALDASAEAALKAKLQVPFLPQVFSLEQLRILEEVSVDLFASIGAIERVGGAGHVFLPPNPVLPPTAVDLDAARMGFLDAIASNLRAHLGFFRALSVSEGELKTLVGMAGQEFTAADLSQLKLWNRLLFVLDEYTTAKIAIYTMSKEQRGLLVRLHSERTVVAAEQRYLNGEILAEEYLVVLKNAAEMIPGLSAKAVVTANTAIGRTLDRLRRLGGSSVGLQSEEGSIQLLERNWAKARAEFSKYELNILRGGDELARLEQELAKASGANASALESRIADLKRALNLDRGLLEESRRTLDEQTRTLVSQYVEFLDHYGKLDLMANLRRGHLGPRESGIAIEPMDLPDALVAAPRELDRWAELVSSFSGGNGRSVAEQVRITLQEQVMGKARTLLMRKELALYVLTRLGRTEMMMLKLKALGNRVTITPALHDLGLGGLDRAIWTDAARLLAKSLPVTVPTGVGSYFLVKFAQYLTTGKVTIPQQTQGLPGK